MSIVQAQSPSRGSVMNVTYWSDYACPFCYIGVMHLERAIENLGVTGQVKVTMRAFELDPRAPKTCDSDTTERFGAKYGLSAAQAAERVAEITELAHEAGLADFDYAATRSTNTFDAHRLTKYAQAVEPQKASALEHALYDAYFCRGLELADHAVLRAVAAQVGLESEAVERVLSTGVCAQEVRLDEREAAMRGVRGVPYFVIAGKTVVPGCVSVERMKDLLREALAAEKPAQDLDALGVCGPDGCAF